MSPDQHPRNSRKPDSRDSNSRELNGAVRSQLPTARSMARLMARWHRLPYQKSLLTAVSFFTLTTLLSQPSWVFSVATRLQPGALYRVEPAITADAAKSPSKVIALTIDDGPSPATGDILAVLDRYGVKATFFTISEYVPSHEQLFRQTIAAGHEIGNHLTTDEPSIRLSPEDFETDLLAAEETLLPYFLTNEKQSLKVSPSAQASSAQVSSTQASSIQSSSTQASLQWLRPGMGFYNAQMVKTAERHGYQLVLGSVFPYDTHLPSSRFASAFILRTVQPGDIIVLHDGEGIEDGCSVGGGGGRLRCGRGQRTAQTLERILPVLQSQGYTITTVSELTNTRSNTR